MKEVFFGHVLIAAMIVVLPCVASAQEEDSMSFSEDEVEEAAASDEEPTESEEAEGGTSEADVLSALGETGDLTADLGGDTAGLPAEEEGKQHPIWAVQRIYALKRGRVDFQPSFGISMNDPYIQHMSVSLAASYYITEVLAVGLSFNWYRWLTVESDLNFQLGRATHQAVPINEYFWGGQLNFTYVPMYGKFAMFKEWILHWDVWVIGGGGMISTRPIPNIDPEYRNFDWDMKIAFNIGIGGRMFLNSRFLALFIELRDYIFPEKLESLSAPTNTVDRLNEDNWLEDGYKLTNNVMLQVGVTILFPFTFEYELPK